jgi:small-conductance mechanosensitive channel
MKCDNVLRLEGRRPSLPQVDAMRVLRLFFIPLAMLIICAAVREPAAAQLVPSLGPSPTGHVSIFSSAPVIVDGSLVLRITALASPPPGAMPIGSRIFLVDGAIAQALAVDPDRKTTIYDPATLVIGVEKEGPEFALVVTDAKHHAPLPILTVTAEDARHANLTALELAQQWQGQLQTALVAALQRRQPEEIHRSTTLIVRVAIALVLVTLLGLLLVRTLRNRALALGIAAGLLLAWLAALTYALLLFPQSVGYGHFIVRSAVRVGLVWIGAVLLDRLLSVAIYHIVRGYALIGVPAGAQARYLLRVPTMSKALDGFTSFVVYFVAALATLSAVDIPVASVVTIGGIAALAVGFAAQSLVRDFLNGLLVLFEDQYVIGDYVMIGEYNGMVERLTLRVVQIRDSRGNLITIPHSTVAQVVNSSRSWSRIDYQISIDTAADVRKAIELLQHVLEGLKEDEAWRDAVIQPFEYVGVEKVSRNGVVLRAVIRTAPLRQFDLRREVNIRVHEAFIADGIALGFDPSAPFVTAPQASLDPT